MLEQVAVGDMARKQAKLVEELFVFKGIKVEVTNFIPNEIIGKEVSISR